MAYGLKASSCDLLNDFSSEPYIPHTYQPNTKATLFETLFVLQCGILKYIFVY